MERVTTTSPMFIVVSFNTTEFDTASRLVTFLSVGKNPTLLATRQTLSQAPSTLTLKIPFESAAVPFFVPFITTVAKGTGVPSSPITLPCTTDGSSNIGLLIAEATTPWVIVHSDSVYFAF